MKINRALKLVSSLVACQLAGILGSIFTAPSIPTWYADLARPSLAPPNWLFAPVWTTLFLLMGISLYLVWDRGMTTRKSKIAISAFGIQLALNVLWSFLFFGLQSPSLALAEIMPLWLAILATTILFYRISRKAGLLLMPYLLWVGFAAFLNYGIWVLNY